MILDLQALRPMLQILANFSQKLEQGMRPPEIRVHIQHTLDQWPHRDAYVNWREGEPWTAERQLGALSKPLSTALDDANEEISTAIALQLLLVTAKQIRSSVNANDHHSLAAIDSLRDRWLLLFFSTPKEFRGSRLFDSNPPLSSDSPSTSGRSILSAAPLFSILISVMDLMDDQMGLFVHDPAETNPFLSVTLMTVNKATLIESGLEEDWLTGPAGFFQEIHPDDIHKIAQALQLAKDAGSSRIEKLRLKAVRDGQNVWREADINIFMPKDLMGGKRIGYFRFTDVRDTGEAVDAT